MQSLLPVFALLVLLAVLLPPITFLVTVLRRQKRAGWTKKSPLLAAATVFAVLALVFNAIFAFLRFDQILHATQTFDGFLMLALVLSWFSFCGRLLLIWTVRFNRRLRRRGMN